MEVTADASDVGTGRGSMLNSEVNMEKGTYLPITIRLYREISEHTKTDNKTDTVARKCTRNNDTHIEYVVVSGLQAVCHVRIMRRWSSNLEQWTIQRPRLWVPSPYDLSPTRRSKPAFQ